MQSDGADSGKQVRREIDAQRTLRFFDGILRERHVLDRAGKRVHDHFCREPIDMLVDAVGRPSAGNLEWGQPIVLWPV